MRPEYRQIAGLQGAIIIVGTITTYFAVTPPAAKAVAFGGCIALASTLFLGWRFKQGERKEGQSAEWHLRQAYRAAIERFIWVAVMLATGFKLLELVPLWMLAGFVGGQAAWLLIPIWTRFENTK